MDEIIGEYKPYIDNVICTDSTEGLAEKIDVKPEILNDTFTPINHAAKVQNDQELRRDPTTGGPRRNAKAEVLDTKGRPIPHLYLADELGEICANQYRGGGNLAECLIWGKIAGENAAHAKEDNVAVDAASAASQHEVHLTSGLKKEDYPTAENQYIGRSSRGMGDEIVVHVIVED